MRDIRVTEVSKAVKKKHLLDSYILRSFSKNPVALFGFAGFFMIILVSLLAPVIAPYSPTEMNYDAILVSPCGDHLLGTDDLGRDILSRILWGGRESLRVSLTAILLAGSVLYLLAIFLFSNLSIVSCTLSHSSFEINGL